MMAVLAALTSRLGLGVLALGLLVAAFSFAGKAREFRSENKSLRADIVTTNEAWAGCRSDLATQKAQNLELRGALDVQNAAVQDWKRRAEQVQSEAERKVAKARREAADYRAKARRVLAAKPQSPDRCQAASQLYVEAFGAGQ